MHTLNGYQQANCGIKNFVPQEGVEYMPSMGTNNLIFVNECPRRELNPQPRP